MVPEGWITAERVAVYPKLVLALYAGLAVVWIGLSHDFIDPEGKPLGADFLGVYAATDLAVHGHLADAYDLSRIAAAERAVVPALAAVFPWHYPPTFNLLIAPLALLPYTAALLIYQVVTLALYLWLVLAIIPDRRAVWVALAFTGVFVNALGGQNGFLSAALLGGGLMLLETRPYAAGALIGLLTYKPQLGLLVPIILVAGGYWRSVAAAAVTALLFALAAAVAFGVESWVAFWTELPVAGGYLREGALPWDKMASLFAAAHLLGANETTASVLHGVVALAVAALSFLAWRRRGGLDLRIALAVTATTLLSPFIYDYDLVLLAVPIAVLGTDGLRTGWTPGLRTLLVIAWVTPLIGGALARYAHLPIMPLVLLALFTACWRRLQLTSAAPIARTPA